jgi:predicted peroxiredoxin
MGALDFMSDNNTNNLPQLIDNVIKNGVKRTEGGVLFDETKVDRIISEGVKETKGGGYLGSIEMKGKIVHQIESPKQNNEVEDVIEHGVKLTNSSLQIDGSCVVEDVIQNGIKETFDETHHRRREVVRTIRDGIKETHDDVYHHKGRVGGVIKNGIKEVKELPDQSGELRGYGDYYHRQEDRTYPFTKTVDDVIRDGIKEVKPAYQLMYNPTNFQPIMLEDKRIANVRDVILDGIKEVRPMDEWVNTTNIIDKVINDGVTESKKI